MRIERSIWPLTVLVERSMHTMRIEKEQCIEASFTLQRLQTADPTLLWVTTDVAGISSFASSFCY